MFKGKKEMILSYMVITIGSIFSCCFIIFVLEFYGRL